MQLVYIKHDDNKIHNFNFTQAGMTLAISSGSIWHNGEQIFTDDTGGEIRFDPVEEDTLVILWICKEGLVVQTANDTNPILGDLPSYPLLNVADFIIPANVTNLDEVKIRIFNHVNGITEEEVNNENIED